MAQGLALFPSLNLGSDLPAFADSVALGMRLIADFLLRSFSCCSGLSWIEAALTWYYSPICAGEAN